MKTFETGSEAGSARRSSFVIAERRSPTGSAALLAGRHAAGDSYRSGPGDQGEKA